MSQVQKYIENTGAIFEPLYSKNLQINLLNKIYDFLLFPSILINIIKKHDINEIIARGSPAGVLAYLTSKKSKIPFSVESFEPHAAYMRFSGVWPACDLRYLFQKKWERELLFKAKMIYPVSNNFKNHLIKIGLSSNKIYTVPCSVDPEKFYIDPFLGTGRVELRQV